MSDQSIAVLEQVRELYSQLRRLGYPADLARTNTSITLLSNAVSALCVVLRQLAKDRHGDDVPSEITRMTGHAETAAVTAMEVALGSLLLEPPDGA